MNKSLTVLELEKRLELPLYGVGGKFCPLCSEPKNSNALFCSKCRKSHPSVIGSCGHELIIETPRIDGNTGIRIVTSYCPVCQLVKPETKANGPSLTLPSVHSYCSPRPRPLSDDTDPNG